MPLVNPIISGTVPVKVGGTPTAGVGKLASAFDHGHGLVELGGPTNLSIGSWLDAEMARRVGTAIVGRQVIFLRLSSNATNATGGNLDVSSQLTAALKTSLSYFFAYFISFRTSATTCGLQVAVNYSGTVSAVRTTLIGANSPTDFQCGTSTGLEIQVGSSGIGPGAVDVGFIFYGTVVTTSAGNFALRFASGNAPATVTINAGTAGMIVQL